MTRGQIWLFSIGAFLLCAAALLFSALWSNLSSEWSVSSTAAEYALNHSVIDHIDDHQVFTSNSVQEVFFGEDAFHRPWYVFVYGNPLQAQSVPATSLITKQRATVLANAAGVHPQTVAVGYLNSQAMAAFHANTDVVWEVYGSNSSGKTAYLYLNAYSGAVVWKYVLST